MDISKLKEPNGTKETAVTQLNDCVDCPGISYLVKPLNRKVSTS